MTHALSLLNRIILHQVGNVGVSCPATDVASDHTTVKRIVEVPHHFPSAEQTKVVQQRCRIHSVRLFMLLGRVSAFPPSSTTIEDQPEELSAGIRMSLHAIHKPKTSKKSPLAHRAMHSCDVRSQSRQTKDLSEIQSSFGRVRPSLSHRAQTGYCVEGTKKSLTSKDRKAAGDLTVLQGTGDTSVPPGNDLLKAAHGGGEKKQQQRHQRAPPVLPAPR